MYSHTQIGYATIILLVFSLYIMVRINSSWVMLGLVGVCMILMTTLTIKVTDESITWFFGPYFLKKTIALKDVYSVSIVKTSWLSGFGIRQLKKGVLYNISGLKAVEVKMNSGDVIMLGTDEPQALLNAIDCQLGSSKLLNDEP